MVSNTTFNNISVIQLRTALLVGKPEVPDKTTDLPHGIDKLYLIMLHQVHIAISVVGDRHCIGIVNPTIIRS